jgi:bifunctional non-homologous end joining protein LigD
MARARPAPGGALRPVAPMLASPGLLPAGRAARAHAYEFKWDGVRALLQAEGGRMRLTSRNGKDLAPAFPELAPLGRLLGERAGGAILDGELVALDAAGRPDFGRLQERLHRTGEANVLAAAAAVPAAYLAFDVLFLDGVDVTGRPYRERRRLLRGLRLRGPAWSAPRHGADGKEMLRASLRLGLEGVVAKRLDSPYLPGQRSAAWVKVRNRLRQEFVVGGWSEGKGARKGTVGSLLMGHYGSAEDPRRLVYVGRVGSGLGGVTLKRLDEALRSLAGPNPFDSSAAEEAGEEGVHYVRPNLVAEVEFSGMTREGRIRQGAFKGLREDKDPRQVVWEQAGPEPGADAG